MFERFLSRRPVSRPAARTAVRRNGRQALIESMDARRYCDGDNSFATAADLGNVATVVTKNGSLTSGSDTKDYYKFTVPASTTTFKAHLSNLGSNANLYLYNSSKSQIGSSTNGGTATELITKQPLSAGTYYAEVRTAGGSTSYKLELVSDAAGSSSGTARDAGTVGSTTKTYTDYVGPLDSADFYKVNISGDGVLNVKLEGLSADANVELRKSDGTTVVQSSSKTGTANENFIFGVHSGTYYVRVFPATGSAATNYTVKLIKNSIPSDPAGESLATAYTLGFDSATSMSVGETIVNEYDTTDYFKINASEPGLVTASLTNLNDDLGVQILSSSGTVLATSSPSGFFANTALYNSTLGGTYYLRVYQRTTGTAASASTYTLQVNKPGDDAGNSIAAAKNVSAPYTKLNANVGGVDSADFFKFSTPDYQYITMDLTGASAATQLKFYDSDGSLLFTRNTAAGEAHLTVFVHTGGVRYFSVNAASLLTPSNYDIKLTTSGF